MQGRRPIVRVVSAETSNSNGLPTEGQPQKEGRREGRKARRSHSLRQTVLATFYSSCDIGCGGVEHFSCHNNYRRLTPLADNLSLHQIRISSVDVLTGVCSLIQSLSDIVTTLGTRQNSHNNQYLSQGNKLYQCPGTKYRGKNVTTSNFCHKVLVTISNKD